jgi:hypothetical protein
VRPNYSSGSLEDKLKHLTPSHSDGRPSYRETTPTSSLEHEYVSYEDIDISQKHEFEKLLKEVLSANAVHP